MHWLLHIPVIGPHWRDGYAFDVDLDLDYNSKDHQSQQLCILDLLRNYSILSHLKTGIGSTSGPIFKEIESSPAVSPTLTKDFEAFYTGEVHKDDSYISCQIIDCFPLARSLLDEIQARCPCPNCTSGRPLGQFKKGCLRSSAVRELFVLLAHSISDAFGAEDVSGLSNFKDHIMVGMVKLFGELIYGKEVVWNTWFRVVACVITGCSWDDFDRDDLDSRSDS